MAKHRLVPTHTKLAGTLLLIGALCASGWASVVRAAQAPPQSAAKRAARHAASMKPLAKGTPSRARRPRERRSKAVAEAVPSSPAKRSIVVAGRRDPFKPPPPPTAPGLPGGPTGPLPPGIRGLLISPLVLEGVVRQDTTNKMIAVVTNYTKRAYFLRENDALYNGVVSKITPDAVYFKENVLGKSGRVTSREVVKRLGPTPGAGEGR